MKLYEHTQPLYRAEDIAPMPPTAALSFLAFLPGGRKMTPAEILHSGITHAASEAFTAFLGTLPPAPDCATCAGKGEYDAEAGSCLRHGLGWRWCDCVARIPGSFGTVYSLSCEIGRELDERDGLP